MKILDACCGSRMFWFDKEHKDTLYMDKRVLSETLCPLNYVDDIKHYLIKCLWTRKCALCGKKGQVHHVDAVGAGRNRKKIDHTKHHLMSLCIGCHEESHKIGQQTFMRKHHVVGVIMNQEQYEKLNYKG